MSVQSFADRDRRARLGLCVGPSIVDRRLIDPQIFETPESEPGAAPPVISADSFAWAHRLADEYGGDATALVTRAEWRLIVEEALVAFDISKADLNSIRKHAPVVWARMCCMWALRTYTPLSLPVIGQKLGGKDHTTVMHAARSVGEIIARIGAPINRNTEWREAIRILAQYKVKPIKRQSCR